MRVRSSVISGAGELSVTCGGGMRICGTAATGVVGTIADGGACGRGTAGRTIRGDVGGEGASVFSGGRVRGEDVRGALNVEMTLDTLGVGAGGLVPERPLSELGDCLTTSDFRGWRPRVGRRLVGDWVREEAEDALEDVLSGRREPGRKSPEPWT